MTAEKCPVEVLDNSGFHSWTCGRPLISGGMCGIHAAADERRARNQAERRKDRQRIESLQGQTSAHAMAIRDITGIHCGVMYSDGSLTFTPADAALLAEWVSRR